MVKNTFQLHRQLIWKSINIEHIGNIKIFCSRVKSVKIYKVYLSQVIATIFINNIFLELQEISDCVSGFSKHFYKGITVTDSVIFMKG